MTDKILIVDALGSGSGQRRSSRDSIGCGPRTIAGVLEKHDVTSKIVRAEDIPASNGTLRGFTHLAISAMTMDLAITQQIVHFWRKSRPRGRVIIGGPIATGAEKIFQELQPDLYVIGEGEHTIEELIRKGFFNSEIDLGGIKGIAYPESNAMMFTNPRPFLESQSCVFLRPSLLLEP